MSIIQYQYGLDQNGKTINIEDLSQSKEVRQQTFKCLACDNILIPVLGLKRTKHFRHKPDVEIKCSNETYLHQLAKLRFYEVYKKRVEKHQLFWISSVIYSYRSTAR